MNNVNVNVDVPLTSQNASTSGTNGTVYPTYPLSNQNQASQTANIAGENPSSASSSSTSKKPLVSPHNEPPIAIFGTIFILIAIILLVFVFREQLINFYQKHFKNGKTDKSKPGQPVVFKPQQNVNQNPPNTENNQGQQSETQPNGTPK